jgi:hypothetical protein
MAMDSEKYEPMAIDFGGLLAIVKAESLDKKPQLGGRGKLSSIVLRRV